MSHHSSADRHPQPWLFTTPTHFPPLAFTHYSQQQQYHQNFPKPQLETNRSVRFRCGMGDGGQAIEETSVVSGRLKLLQAVNPIHYLASSFAYPFLPANNFKKPVGGGFVAIETGASGSGTGVFLPVYHTRISCTNNNGSCGGGERDEGEHEGRDYDVEDDIPIEKLLPSEWTY